MEKYIIRIRNKKLNMNSLVVGSTSQLSYFFPSSYAKISSRDINFKKLKETKWDRIFICFGESRKYIDNIQNYNDINFKLILKVIDELKSNCNKIVVYSTCELWNKLSGTISLEDDFDFYPTPYLDSKYKITKYILDNQEKYKNVIILYPFNFNSTYRSENFLFGKIFKSIINKVKIEIGDTYFYRDLVHPKYVVNQSITSENHQIIGSGRLTFVNDFIKDIYNNFNLNYSDYVTEFKSNFKEYNKNNEYYLKSEMCLYSYDELKSDTIKDLNHKIHLYNMTNIQ